MIQHAITQGELTRVVLGLLSVLLLIVALSWLVKRLQHAQISSSKGFLTIASMMLGPKEKVVLLKVGSKYLLLGLGGAQISLLCDFGEQLPSGFESTNKTSFAELLKSVVVKSQK